jgi:hypothetical protein
MDVIGFLYVSLCGSTAQLHNSVDAHAHAHVQRLVSVVKMVTMLEEYITEEQHSVAFFCVQKDSVQRIFINKCFLFTVGSICRVKRFTAG